MNSSPNETHDPGIRSCVPSANEPGTDFPLQNLPFGVFRRRGKRESFRVGTAIGDRILDIPACLEAGLLGGGAAAAAEACRRGELNALMALDPACCSQLRLGLSRLLRSDSPALRGMPSPGDRLLVPIAEAEFSVPAAIGDYTDFYASIHHAANVGSMFRPEHPLLPNYKHLPVGYHGRASSIVPDGTPVRRPRGQILDGPSSSPRFEPSGQLDYELEVGFYVGAGNPLGKPIPIEKAGEHIFGFCLLNDWSARDIQSWEYQPLGPFLAKSFATSVSPWIVTLEALGPFRVPARRRPEGDPETLPYLRSADDAARGGFDICVEVFLRSEEMRRRGIEPIRISVGNFGDMYWTPAQMLAHHASNGCNLRPGDLLASGTVSGPERESRGCLLELTRRGAEPLSLPTNERRRFLEDGDEVILRGHCQRQGAVRIGFGECRGIVLPA